MFIQGLYGEAPNFSVADVHAGWAEALRGLGEQVAEYPLDRRLTFFDAALVETGTFDDDGHAQVRKFVSRDDAILMAAEGIKAACLDVWPDVVLCTSAFFTPPGVLEVLRARRFKIVMLFTEGPYQTGTQLEMAEYADLCLLNDPCDIGKYRALTRAEYMPHAYRPALHHPGPAIPEMVCDLGFVGTGFPSRIEFFEAMDLGGLDVILAGNWLGLVATASPLLKHVAHETDRCLDNAQAADLYRSARAGINFYRRESEGDQAVPWAMGPREVEMAAAGLFFLRDPRPEGDEVLPMLPTFASPGEASEKLRFFLARDGLRQDAAAQARAAVAGRTFDKHARKLLAWLDR